MESSQKPTFRDAVRSLKENLEQLFQMAYLDPDCDGVYVENLHQLILLCENYFQLAEDDVEGKWQVKKMLGILLKEFVDRYGSDPMSEIDETLKNLAISTETTLEEQKDEKDKTE